MGNSNVRPFTDTLRELRRGQTLDELSDKLNELVAAVKDTGKKGSISLTVEVKPASKTESYALLITDDIKARIPVHERASTLFFPTPENNLQRTDPNQTELQLEQVPTTKQQEEEPIRINNSEASA